MKYIYCILLLTLSLLLSCRETTPDVEPEPDIPCFSGDCETYFSREEALDALRDHPECRSELDPNSNGIPCDEPGNLNNCRDTNCANYTSQAAAQVAFDLDPECRNDLDADNDGIACEEPGNSVKTCDTTSQCGCSGHNKSPCQSDPCCQWIVGDGCKCA